MSRNNRHISHRETESLDGKAKGVTKRKCGEKSRVIAKPELYFGIFFAP